MVCDSDSQYCLNAIPYCGIGSVPHQYQNMLQGEYFTMELLRPNLIQPGRVVCADNWFTSLSLARSLLQKGMHLVGTILKKPQLPCQYVLDCKIPMKDNLAIYNHKERINVIFKRTKPKKVLGIITTIHNVFSNVEDKKTEAHMFYNASKGGVDTFDHMCAHYDIGRKTRRWPLCVFYGLLNIATTNSFVIFTSRPENKQTRHDFSQDLAWNLARPHARHRYMNRQYLRKELSDQIRVLFLLDDDGDQHEQPPDDDEGPPAPPRPAPPRPDEAAPDPAVAGPSRAVDPADAADPQDDSTTKPHYKYLEIGFEGGRILDDKRQRCHYCLRKVKWRGKEKCNTCLNNVCLKHSQIICMYCRQQRQ